MEQAEVHLWSSSSQRDESTSDVLARSAAVIETAEARLVAIEASLRALAEGHYGRCVVCAAPIDREALKADPTETRCATHRSQP